MYAKEEDGACEGSNQAVLSNDFHWFVPIVPNRRTIPGMSRARGCRDRGTEQGDLEATARERSRSQRWGIACTKAVYNYIHHTYVCFLVWSMRCT